MLLYILSNTHLFRHMPCVYPAIFGLIYIQLPYTYFQVPFICFLSIKTTTTMNTATTTTTATATTTTTAKLKFQISEKCTPDSPQFCHSTSFLFLLLSYLYIICIIFYFEMVYISTCTSNTGNNIGIASDNIRTA